MVPSAKEIVPMCEGNVSMHKGNGPMREENSPASKGNGPAWRKWSRTKEMVPREGNGPAWRKWSHAKEMVPREGNGPARRKWFCVREMVPHKGNGPTQRKWSRAKEMVLRKGNGPVRRKWSHDGFQSPIQTPSQWDCCLLANHGAFWTLKCIQSEALKPPTTHLATYIIDAWYVLFPNSEYFPENLKFARYILYYSISFFVFHDWKTNQYFILFFQWVSGFFQSFPFWFPVPFCLCSCLPISCPWLV